MMFLGLVKFYWKEAIAYKAEFFLSLVSVPLRFLVLIMIWKAVYLSQDVVAGYTLPSLITYFIVTQFIHMFISDDISQQTQRLVRTGNFLVNLIRPIEYAFMGFVKKIANRFFSLFVEIMPIIIVLMLFFPQYLVHGNYIAALISTFIAFILSYLIDYTIATLAFWMTRVRSLMWMLHFMISLASGSFIPIDMYPSFVKTILSYLPFQYLSFVPAQIYLGKIGGAGNFRQILFSITIQMMWCLILFVIVLIVHKLAMKRFRGEGA